MARDLMSSKARELADEVASRVDVAYFVAPHLLNSEVAKRLRASGTMVVSHIHDPRPHSGQRHSRVVIKSQARLIRFSDLVVVYGNAVEQQLRATYPSAVDVLSLPLPAPIGEFAGYPLGRRNLIVFQGRIQSYKGLDDFIEAVRIARPELSALVPVVATPDQLSRKQAEACARAGISVRQGLLTDEELRALMSSAVMGVLPYRDATQSGVLSNFFACGTPVVASKVGGIAEVVSDGQTGLLCQPNNPVEVAKAMVELATTIDSNSMGRLAFEYFVRELSWSSFADRFLARVSSGGRQ
jgi:glycosyltransferase involved in cell wall biosynthesis